MGIVESTSMLFYFLGAVAITAFVATLLRCTKKIVSAIEENTEQIKRLTNIKSQELNKNRFK